MLDAVIRRTISESVRRARPITVADSFPKQWEYITSRERFVALKCSRRAGKTRGTAWRTAKRCSEQPGRRVLYINLTALNAQLQFFDRLTAILDAKGIAYRADNSDLLVYFGNGSFLRAMGCDNLGEVKTKLGDGWDEIIIDEMQSYSDPVLFELVDRAILPMLVDNNGSLVCQGTPAVTKAGFWFDLYTKSTFKKFFWTLFDNPFIAHDIETIIAKRGLKITDALVRREYFGEDCVDPSAMVFKYLAGRNDIAPVEPHKDRWVYTNSKGKQFFETVRPDPMHESWRFALGMDLGFSDNDAIVVLGWRMDDPEKRLYECFSWQENHLDYLKLADVFKAVAEHYLPQGICIDTGGHGARKIMESLKAVFSCFRYTLKPASVLDSIGLVNDELRTGRMLFDPNGLCAHDANLVVWKPGEHDKTVSDTFHSDIMAALRYAHSCAYHHQAEAPGTESDAERHIRQWEERKAVEADPHNPYRSTGAQAW